MSGEFARIDRLKRLFAAEESVRAIIPIGDDAAVVIPDGAVSVTSVDAVNDGVHFRRGRWPARAIGRKAVAAALSDLAAMAARPGEVYVAAGLPADLDDEEFDQLCVGMSDAADGAGAIIVGGDMSSSQRLWLSVTVVGYADSAERILTRKGAQVGDVVAVTGALGGSALALERIELADAPLAADAPEFARQFAPTPRFGAAAALLASGASSLIDVSDGLAGDVGHIAAQSGVELAVELDLLPLAEELEGREGAAEFAAASGEEYELIATIQEGAFEAAVQAVAATGVSLTRIGRVQRGSGARLVSADGAVADVRGFDHFD